MKKNRTTKNELKRLIKLDTNVATTLKKNSLTKDERKVLEYFKKKLEIFIYDNSSR